MKCYVQNVQFKYITKLSLFLANLNVLVDSYKVNRCTVMFSLFKLTLTFYFPSSIHFTMKWKIFTKLCSIVFNNDIYCLSMTTFIYVHSIIYS